MKPILFLANGPLGAVGPFPEGLRLGVPRKGQLLFFGDRVSEAAYASAVERLIGLGAKVVEFDLEPFYETARLLYEGPWVAERYITARDLIASSPDALHPVTREITIGGRAVDCSRYLCCPLSARRLAQDERTNVSDHRCVCFARPRRPRYTVEQVLANPIELNSRLGSYTRISSTCSI